MPVKKSWDILSKINSHPRDERIEFQEEGHRYKIDGSVEGWTSATSLLSSLHEPFNAEKAADTLINGRRYKSGEHPLAGKSKEDIIAHWGNENKRGTALHARMEFGMQCISLGNPIGRVSKDTLVLTRCSGTFDSEDRHRVSHNASTQEVFIRYPTVDSAPIEGLVRELLHIGFMWSDGTVRRNRLEEAELGEDEPVLGWNESIQEALQVKEFWEEYACKNGLKPYRSEWVIWDEEFRIAGTIDALMKNEKTGGYWIYDWKRVSRGLEVDIEATRYGYRPKHDEWLAETKPWVKRMCHPVEELFDTKYWHYSLQLNLYRSILERRYGITIEGMMLVQIHPSLAGVRCHEVVRLEDPINRILEKRRTEMSGGTEGNIRE